MKTAQDLVLAAKSQCTEVSIEQAAELIRSTEVIIDVREADEYNAGHVANAIHIPRGLLEFKLSGTPELERRDIRVLLYCKTSGRSALAAATMQAMGYQNVVSMAGGLDAWVAGGGSVVKA